MHIIMSIRLYSSAFYEGRDESFRRCGYNFDHEVGTFSFMVFRGSYGVFIEYFFLYESFSYNSICLLTGY